MSQMALRTHPSFHDRTLLVAMSMVHVYAALATASGASDDIGSKIASLAVRAQVPTTLQGKPALNCLFRLPTPLCVRDVNNTLKQHTLSVSVVPTAMLQQRPLLPACCEPNHGLRPCEGRAGTSSYTCTLTRTRTPLQSQCPDNL